MTELGGSRPPILQLGDTGGLRVDRYGNRLQFAVFEMIRGHQVDRATVVVSVDAAVDLIKILCRQCGVEMEGYNGEKIR